MEELASSEAENQTATNVGESAGMVAGRVVEEVAVISAQKGGSSEGRDAGAANVAQPRLRLHDKALLERELGLGESGTETATEINILPPGRGECWVETAHGLPHPPPHQPCCGGRLRHRDWSCRNRGGKAPAGQAEGESGGGWKLTELPPVLRNTIHILEERDRPYCPRVIGEELNQSIDCTSGDDGIRVEQEQVRLVALGSAAIGGMCEAVILFEGDDLDFGKLGGQSFCAAVTRTRVNQDDMTQVGSTIVEEGPQTSSNLLPAAPPNHHGADRVRHRNPRTDRRARVTAARSAAGPNPRRGVAGSSTRVSMSGRATTDQRQSFLWSASFPRHRF